MAKNRLFQHSGEYGYKFNGKWGKLNTAERVHRNLVQGIFNVKNPKDIAKKDIQDLKKVVKEMSKEVKKRVEKLKNLGKGRKVITPALLDLEENGGIDENKTEVSDIIDEYIKAKSFLDDETSTQEGAEDFVTIVAEEDDKWTILHRLEKIDPRLLVQRGYASQVLDEIEVYMSENTYSIDEVTDIMIERLDELYGDAQDESQYITPFGY